MIIIWNNKETGNEQLKLNIRSRYSLVYCNMFMYPHYIMLLGCRSSDNVVLDLWFGWSKYMFSTPAAPERQWTPEDSASEPRPIHTAALAIPGERTGVAELDERGFLKVGLPETANNHYIFFWLSGRALDSGRQKGEFKSPCLCFFAFLPLLPCFLLLLYSGCSINSS